MSGGVRQEEKETNDEMEAWPIDVSMDWKHCFPTGLDSIRFGLGQLVKDSRRICS